MSNRVDELETKVKELRAAVNGLTEELVESKERIRQLEDAVDLDDPAVRSTSRPEPDEQADADDATASTETDAPASEAADADDVAADTDAEDADDEPEQRFVDAEEHEPELESSLGPEGTNDEETKSGQSNEEETESEGSDIIVA